MGQVADGELVEPSAVIAALALRLAATLQWSYEDVLARCTLREAMLLALLSEQQPAAPQEPPDDVDGFIREVMGS